LPDKICQSANLTLPPNFTEIIIYQKLLKKSSTYIIGKSERRQEGETALLLVTGANSYKLGKLQILIKFKKFKK
jgi:hypothetical protein